MALIKSISGIRGTIGGVSGHNLTPTDIVECAAAFGTWVLQNGKNAKIIIGRDARISGNVVNQLVTQTLISLGIDVIDLGLSTTPTVEIAVPLEGAGAGIVITASHNPKQWNALKFLNEKGEFISATDGADILSLIGTDKITFATVDNLGSYQINDTYIQKHIDQILALPLVDKDVIKSKNFKIVVDVVNSTGAISIIPLLEQLGCEVITLFGEMTGQFAHNPEPLSENLQELSKAVVSGRAHLGIAVDPDVDRLAFVCEDGEMFGEEYTLVTIADYILSHKKGNTVSNLSSTKALADVTEKHKCEYFSSAVGEVNVVAKMKAVNAVIGGEGNGGVIYPELHYGRDALVGVALFLTQLAIFGKSASFLRSRYPSYFISKNKIEFQSDVDLDDIFEKLQEKYKKSQINTEDGLKITLPTGEWIHLRRSNTEPIVRIYSESNSEVVAGNLTQKIKADITDILQSKQI